MTELDEQLTLPPEPASAAAARRFAARALGGVDVDLALVTLLVSELVSNVVLHARTPLTVAVRTSGRRVRVTVSDRSPTLPAPKTYAPDAVTGRGLTMVASSCADWGVEPTPGGKAVWFEVPMEQVASLS